MRCFGILGNEFLSQMSIVCTVLDNKMISFLRDCNCFPEDGVYLFMALLLTSSC